MAYIELNDPDSYAYGAALRAKEKREEHAIDDHKEIIETALASLEALKGQMSESNLGYVWDAIVEGIHTQIEKCTDHDTGWAVRNHMDYLVRRAYPEMFS